MFGFGLFFLSEISAADGNALEVHVNGEQWLWDYEYTQYSGVHTTTLVLPVDRPVTFAITSTDVQHSFWIPALGVKQDAVPGETTRISVTPNKIGEYEVRCAELCGLYHAYMQTPVKVVSDSDFDAWVQSQMRDHPTPTPVPSPQPTSQASRPVDPRASMGAKN